jgi:hypothetical protein
MLTPNPAVRVISGVPKLADFGNKIGTPIVIDRDTGYGYYLDGDVIRTLQAGPFNPTGSFSNGFDSGV